MPTETNLTQFNDILGWATFTSSDIFLTATNSGNTATYTTLNLLIPNYITNGGTLQQLFSKGSVSVNNFSFAGGTYLISTSLTFFSRIPNESLFVRFAVSDTTGILSTTIDQPVWSFGNRNTNLQAIVDIQQGQWISLQFRNLSSASATNKFSIPSVVINAIRIK